MNGRGEDKVAREEEGVTEAVAAMETEAEEAEGEEEVMDRERDDCARWRWREECKRREGWRESEREGMSE